MLICPCYVKSVRGQWAKGGGDLAMKKNAPGWYLSAEVWLSAYCLTRRWRSGLPAFRTGHQDGVQPFAKTIRTSRIYHTTTPLNKTPGWSSFCRSVIICLLSHTEVKVWTSGFQNRSSRRSPAFCPKIGHQLYTIQLHLLDKTLVDAIRSDPRYSRSGIPTFRTGHQDGIQPFPYTIGHQGFTIQLRRLNKFPVDTLRSEPW